MKGLEDMLGAPVDRCWAGGHSAAHIMAIKAVPAMAVSRRAIPLISATPMPSRLSMNSQSVQPLPAMSWKNDWRGPAETPDRKPLVGEPPLIQLLLEPVA